MNRRDVLIGSLLAVALGILLAPMASIGIDPHHEGVMLKTALDVLSGQVLFRETFTQYGALTTYLQVAALAIHPSLLALRVLTIGAYAVALFFLYATWRQILPRPLAVFSCALFTLFMPCYDQNWVGGEWLLLPWSSVYALMFQSLGLYALSRVICDEQAARWGAILGASCACVFWCRQPVGVIMTGGVVASWGALYFAGWAPGRTTRRTIQTNIIAGFVAVNAVLLGSVLLTNAVPEWWYQNFTWPAKWARESTTASLGLFASYFLQPKAAAGLLLLLVLVIAPGALPRLATALGRRGLAAYYLGLAGLAAWQHERVLDMLGVRLGGWTVLLPAVIVVLALGCLIAVFRRPAIPRNLEYYLIAALAAQAAGALFQYYPVPDSRHTHWALAPGFGLAVYAFWRGSRWSPSTATTVLTLLFLPALVMKLHSARQMLAQPRVTLEHPAVLQGLRVSPEQARTLDQVASFVARVEQHQPGTPSVLIGSDALFLCFSRNLANPSPYFVGWQGLIDAAGNLHRLEYIETTRPLLILHKARWDVVGNFYRRARYVPVLYVTEEALEIALPQELADAMGLKVYGASAPAGPVQTISHP